MCEMLLPYKVRSYCYNEATAANKQGFNATTVKCHKPTHVITRIDPALPVG